MYIFVYPVVIIIRYLNVYEERSLSIYSGDEFFNSDSDLKLTGGGLKLKLYLINGALLLALPLMRCLSRSITAVNIRRVLQRTFTMNSVSVPFITCNRNKLNSILTLGLPHGSSNPNSRISFVSQQIYEQLAYDI